MNPNLFSRFTAIVCILLLSIFAGKANAQTYCTPAFLQGCTFGDEINDFVLNGVSGTSINDLATGCAGTIGGGYDNRIGESVTLNAGGTYTVSVDDKAGAILPDNFQIWIDFNDNGTFEASESLGGGALPNIAGIGTGVLTAFTITIPAGAAAGSHRMRAEVSGSDVYPSVNPCPTALASPDGEVHDYTAVISGSVASCGVPTGLAASSVTSTSAVLNWSEPAGSVGSEYVVSTASATPAGSGTQTTALTYNPTGLTPSTVYYAFVRDSCGPASLSAWVSTTFTTTASATTTCNPVVLNTPGAITTTSATISWTAVAGSIGYVYAVDNSVTPPTSGTFTTLTSANITGLTAGTTYYAHVRDSCGVGSESVWETIPFTTLAGAGGCNAVTTLNATSITPTSAVINWTMASGAVGAEYVINTTAADPVGSGTGTTASTYNATGLTPATLYYAHVRDSCGATSLSAWVTIPFTTLGPTWVNNMSSAGFSITAFPNPVKDEVTVKIDGTAGKPGQVQLMDISGKLLKTEITDGNMLNMNMSGLPSGIYLIRYIDAAHTQTIKINKQ